MATFPIHREELAKLLGVTVQWCEDMHYGMPCARRVDGSAWWLSDDAQLEVWKQYADAWNNPPEPQPQPVRPVEAPYSSAFSAGWTNTGSASESSSSSRP